MECKENKEGQEAMHTVLLPVFEKKKINPILHMLIIAGMTKQDIGILTRKHMGIHCQPHDRLINQQTKIGWKQLRYSRFVKEWANMQERYNDMMRLHMQIPNNEQWLGQVINTILISMQKQDGYIGTRGCIQPGK
eukprot:3521509-Ditylum_brightwellii.AAC.1